MWAFCSLFYQLQFHIRNIVLQLSAQQIAYQWVAINSIFITLANNDPFHAHSALIRIRFLSNRPRDEKLPKWKEFSRAGRLAVAYFHFPLSSPARHRTHIDNANIACPVHVSVVFPAHLSYPERFHLTNTHKSIGNHHNSDSNETEWVRYVHVFEWLVWFGIAFGVRESQKESATRGTRLDAESKKGHADMRIPLPWLTFPCRRRSVRLSVMRRTCSLLFQNSVHASKASQPNNMTNVDFYWN